MKILTKRNGYRFKITYEKNLLNDKVKSYLNLINSIIRICITYITGKINNKNLL